MSSGTVMITSKSGYVCYGVLCFSSDALETTTALIPKRVQVTFLETAATLSRKPISKNNTNGDIQLYC